MSEFVDECRREWRRLGVPDPIANEMAADLSADLDEAQSEGGSPEDVLGNSAFDPRRFAAAWATSRGVVGTPARGPRTLWNLAVVFAASLGTLALLAGLVMLSVRGTRSISIARRFAMGQFPIRPFRPGMPQIALPFQPRLPYMGAQITPDFMFHPLALMLLVVGVAGIVTVLLYWSHSLWSHRFLRRREGSSGTKMN